MKNEIVIQLEKNTLNEQAKKNLIEKVFNLYIILADDFFGENKNITEYLGYLLNITANILDKAIETASEEEIKGVQKEVEQLYTKYLNTTDEHLKN